MKKVIGIGISGIVGFLIGRQISKSEKPAKQVKAKEESRTVVKLPDSVSEFKLIPNSYPNFTLKTLSSGDEQPQLQTRSSEASNQVPKCKPGLTLA